MSKGSEYRSEVAICEFAPCRFEWLRVARCRRDRAQIAGRILFAEARDGFGAVRLEIGGKFRDKLAV